MRTNKLSSADISTHVKIWDEHQDRLLDKLIYIVNLQFVEQIFQLVPGILSKNHARVVLFHYLQTQICVHALLLQQYGIDLCSLVIYSDPLGCQVHEELRFYQKHPYLEIPGYQTPSSQSRTESHCQLKQMFFAYWHRPTRSNIGKNDVLRENTLETNVKSCLDSTHTSFTISNLILRLNDYKFSYCARQHDTLPNWVDILYPILLL